MDMLEIGTGTMTIYEEQTHFSFWAALKSPLIIGADITKISNSSLNILLNKEIISISQDDAGIAASYIPELSTEGSLQIWAGPLSEGKFVIMALNESKNATSIAIPLNRIPNLENPEGKYKIRDIWEAKDLGSSGRSIILPNIGSHQTKVLVISSA